MTETVSIPNDQTQGYPLLLRLFSTDENEAAERYMLTRAKLVAYFEGRRLSPSEDLADEVLFRAAQKIGAGEQVEEINRYVYGVARFVRLESFRRPQSVSIDDVGEGIGERPRPVPDALRVSPVIFDGETDGAARRCLGICLGSLSNEHRNLILSYYAADERRGSHIDQRKALATRLGKSAGALQKQICLLRQKVASCTKNCVDGKG